MEKRWEPEANSIKIERFGEKKNGGPYGTRFCWVWYKDDLFHRDDGPALIGKIDGSFAWMQNGHSHRLDGPATEGPNHSSPAWWINGEKIFVKSNEEFLKHPERRRYIMRAFQ